MNKEQVLAELKYYIDKYPEDVLDCVKALKIQASSEKELEVFELIEKICLLKLKKTQ